MRRRIALSLGCLLAALSTSCTTIKAHWMARTATNGLYSIEKYEAQVTERGLLRREPGVPVVKTILYERPWKVRAEVVAPAAHAGELFVFDGTTMSIWWPQSRVGLRIRGIENPERRDVAGVMLESAYWILDHYDLEDRGLGHRAGREVHHWRCEPDEELPLVKPYDAWLDVENLAPLQVSVRNPDGGEWYGMEFDSIDFGTTVPPGAFRFEFPADAMVFDCDLAGPHVPLPEAQELLEFPVLVPAELPAGHEVRKVILGGDLEEAPIVALLMPKGARWLSLSEMMYTSPANVPDVGIAVKIGEREGVLNFAFGYTIVSWVVDNTALTLIGNLPYPEMVAIAASVGPLKVPVK
jgi:outer membrane lipoprotein-sorting protein